MSPSDRRREASRRSGALQRSAGNRVASAAISSLMTSAGRGAYPRAAASFEPGPCAATTSPPPYFPTTGHFVRSRYFEVDPTGFNIATYWAQLVPHQ